MNDIFNENVPLKTETPAFAKHVLPAVPSSEVYLEDCVKALKRFNDNHFDLAIVDPPYGIGFDGEVKEMANNNSKKWKSAKGKNYTRKSWDCETPSKEYFAELQRVSKNQIVWGGNYFPLPPSQGFLIWDKKQPQDFSLAMCEFAWSSIQSPAKMFRFSVLTERDKIHPTQKPKQLYKWILQLYAKEGDLILDTHVGSGSSRIACNELHFAFTGFEIDKDYYEAQEKRFKDFVSQLRMF